MYNCCFSPCTFESDKLLDSFLHITVVPKCAGDFCYRPASSPRADFFMMWMCSALNAKMCAMDVKIPVEWLCVRCSN